jgi:hypothetical protein
MQWLLDSRPICRSPTANPHRVRPTTLWLPGLSPDGLISQAGTVRRRKPSLGGCPLSLWVRCVYVLRQPAISMGIPRLCPCDGLGLVRARARSACRRPTRWARLASRRGRTRLARPTGLARRVGGRGGRGEPGRWTEGTSLHAGLPIQIVGLAACMGCDNPQSRWVSPRLVPCDGRWYRPSGRRGPTCWQPTQSAQRAPPSRLVRPPGWRGLTSWPCWCVARLVRPGWCGGRGRSPRTAGYSRGDSHRGYPLSWWVRVRICNATTRNLSGYPRRLCSWPDGGSTRGRHGLAVRRPTLLARWAGSPRWRGRPC